MKNLFSFTSAFLIVIFTTCFNVNLQSQSVVTFDTLHLSPNSYWNGADLSGGFWCNEAFFPNVFVDWGGGVTSWGVFAYSNKTDTVTTGYLNQYSSYAGSGYNHSANFAIGYYDGSHDVCVKLNSSSQGDTISGFYITNNSYSGMSMKKGDGYSKKFTGADHDWFLLTITAYRNGLRKADTVNFYLADFRFADTTQNYIVKDWRWLDLNRLGAVDSIKFKFSSSDNGLYGMNTPAYFCMDNMTIKSQNFTGITEHRDFAANFSVYPNPASDQIHFIKPENFKSITISDLSGRRVYSSGNFEPAIAISTWEKGIYMVTIQTTSEVHSGKFVKN